MTPAPTADLSRKCETETENFLRQRAYDPQACYELFIRAFRHGDSAAFGRLLVVYNGLVIHWAKQHGLYERLRDEREQIGYYAFTKMWRSTHGERFRFDTLPAILAYLRDCINAALFEMYRDFVGQRRVPQVTYEYGYEPAGAVGVEPMLESAPDFGFLWQRVVELLPEAELQHVVWYSYVEGYTPEGLVAHFGAQYQTKEVVRKLKQKAMRRLRKDALLRRWFGLPPEAEV